MLSPWGNIEGLYFNDSDEIGNFLWKLQNDLEEYYGEKQKIFIKIGADTEEEYYDIMYKLQKNYDDVRCYGTSIDGSLDIIVDTDDFFNDDSENLTIQASGRDNIGTEKEAKK